MVTGFDYGVIILSKDEAGVAQLARPQRLSVAMAGG